MAHERKARSEHFQSAFAPKADIARSIERLVGGENSELLAFFTDHSDLGNADLVVHSRLIAAAVDRFVLSCRDRVDTDNKPASRQTLTPSGWYARAEPKLAFFRQSLAGEPVKFSTRNVWRDFPGESIP